MKWFKALMTVLLISLWWPPSTHSQGIYFYDSDPDIMILGNDTYYEIGLRKSNGSIAYITDKSTGQHVTLGSRYECLWGAVFPDGTPDYVGGCNFSATGTNRFSYTWSPNTHRLTLNYTPASGSSQQVTAQVIIEASVEPWFDMWLELQNDWGYVLDYVLFPSDIVFIEDDINEALLPILPGVVLEQGFFQQNKSYTAKYPGYPGLFADYVSLSSRKGSIAIYSLYDSNYVHPIVMGFVHDDSYVSDSTFYYHTFGIGIDNGQAWTTPRVRIRVSQSALETIGAYRIENGLAQSPALDEKLGERYDRVVQSPLLKMDATQLAIPFSQYADLLAHVPSPALLHPVAFQPRGHDENYPDFLPPASTWGTTSDFANMFYHAQSMGFLVMPYTNPTWWDDESPTLQNLSPAEVLDVAALDYQGNPIYEYYGGHGGYVVSPYRPFVQRRLEQLVASMTTDVPSDMLFEDQIGARPWIFDYNASSAYPTAYIDGWLEHTRVYSRSLLMTELAFDRLVEAEVGFHGSVLLPERLGYTSNWWGVDTWHPYPLAPLMAHDKVLFYQHNLAPETFTFDKATLTWNLAFGYMLSYDLVESTFGGGLTSEWLKLVTEFQQNVLARYANEAVTGFESLDENTTRTFFETYIVTTNWSNTNSYDIERYTLPPLGVLVTNTDSTVTAGIFTRYNDETLSTGEHYLIEIRNSHKVTIYQPIGADTDLNINMLPGWSQNSSIEAWAYASTGRLIGRVPVTITSQNVAIRYQQQLSGQAVAYYEILQPNHTFLPLILKYKAQ